MIQCLLNILFMKLCELTCTCDMWHLKHVVWVIDTYLCRMTCSLWRKMFFSKTSTASVQPVLTNRFGPWSETQQIITSHIMQLCHRHDLFCAVTSLLLLVLLWWWWKKYKGISRWQSIWQDTHTLSQALFTYTCWHLDDFEVEMIEAHITWPNTLHYKTVWALMKCKCMSYRITAF